MVQTRRSPARATVYRPDIGGVLPLYVADRYEGIDARPFPDLSEAEVERYCRRQRRGRARGGRARPAGRRAGEPPRDGPGDPRPGAGLVPYAVKIHGSALEYTVKPYPRFKPYAVEGLAGARGVLVGSRHTAESLWAEMDDPSLPARTRLGPPGVDVARFAPRDPEAARAGLAALRERLAAASTADADAPDGAPAAGDPPRPRPRSTATSARRSPPSTRSSPATG